MFYYLEGKVAHVEPYLAVIDCGGVGYACRTTNHTIRQLKKGEVKRLYTYLNVGDGIFELYGFATEQELNSFKLLIGVSGGYQTGKCRNPNHLPHGKDSEGGYLGRFRDRC